MPQPALTAADHAVITREMARATAHRLGHRVIFSPKPDPELVGNGVHIHMSLVDAAGRPATHAPGEPMELSKPAQHFFAGVLHHMPAICAITAPSPVSYLRLTPNAWAPTVIDLVRQDRGATLRICPIFAAATPAEMTRQFHVEFRATDAAASPYLALGAVIFAGVDGIRRGLPLPTSRPAGAPAPLPAGGARPARRQRDGGRLVRPDPFRRLSAGSSASRRKRWRGCRRPSSAPATPRFIDGKGEQLLDPDEPNPVTLENEPGGSVFFLTCEHAGRAIPRRLGRLGLPEAETLRHIAWDIGIGAVGQRAFAPVGRGGDPADLFAAGDRLQPRPQCPELDPGDQRDDGDSRQSRPRRG